MHTRKEQQGFQEEVEEEVEDAVAAAVAVDAAADAAAAVLLRSPSSQLPIPSVQSIIEDPL